MSWTFNFICEGMPVLMQVLGRKWIGDWLLTIVDLNLNMSARYFWTVLRIGPHLVRVIAVFTTKIGSRGDTENSFQTLHQRAVRNRFWGSDVGCKSAWNVDFGGKKIKKKRKIFRVRFQKYQNESEKIFGGCDRVWLPWFYHEFLPGDICWKYLKKDDHKS